ncbi:MAG: DNA mismatch repair endonuclease MutL [Candidatus Woesearchaeota archaeon]|nr:DNA mismatch repair endonuclease MutL [Candidatus Woesearchaeota archaeon]
MPIIVLDESTVSKIAAGEVIERPASIVKELIENSIDAGSSQISIEADNGGIDRIKISDDGVGMSNEDVSLCWKKHTTSKLKDANDLFSIDTLGFRGEALFSISSVSEISITSRREEDRIGRRIIVQGGNLLLDEPFGCQKGTIIEIKNLFFNTPARKKYLKPKENELSHISDVVSKYALIHPEIRFRLISSGKTLIETLGNGQIEAISCVLGKDVAKNMVAIAYDLGKLNITGYITKPILTRATKNEQSIYVNKRYIKNSVISNAINNAFHTRVMVGRYPIAILNIEIDPNEIDVNVHPQKTQIRIKNEKEVYDAVFSSVKDALCAVEHIPSAENVRLSDFSQAAEPKYDFSENQQMLVKEESEVKSPNFAEMKILGIVNRTYIIAETAGGMLMIDQHAAAERILYERFTLQLREKDVKTQRLLSDEIIEITPKLFQLALKNRDLLKELGYETEEFGQNSLRVSTVPIVLGRQFDKTRFIDYLYDLEKGKPESLEKFFHARVARMACRTAIKAGDDITLPEIKKYVQELMAMDIPYNCPHGRPIMVKISLYELEKMFKRIV